MQPGKEKSKPKGETPHSTSNPEVQNSAEMTAKMHFYAVRNAGEQLRWASPVRTGRQPDRMVGR